MQAEAAYLKKGKGTAMQAQLLREPSRARSILEQPSKISASKIKIVGQDQGLARATRHLEKLTSQVQDLLEINQTLNLDQPPLDLAIDSEEGWRRSQGVEQSRKGDSIAAHEPRFIEKRGFDEN